MPRPRRLRLTERNEARRIDVTPLVYHTSHDGPQLAFISPHSLPRPGGGTGPRRRGVTSAARRSAARCRSAWIGFAGRVTAQLIGAIATVGLGYALVTNHAGRKAEVAARRSRHGARSRSGPRRARLPPPWFASVRTSGPALAVLPFEDFSPDATGTSLADGVTEAVTAALAREGRVHVTRALLPCTCGRRRRHCVTSLPHSAWTSSWKGRSCDRAIGRA